MNKWRQWIILPALFLFASCAKEGQWVIFCTSDTHSEYFPFEGGEEMVGGASRMAALLEHLEDETDGVFTLVSCGGLLTGTDIGAFYRGEVGIRLMNRMNYDLMNVGYHELDYGLDHLKDLESVADFPLLSANLSVKDENSDGFPAYEILKIFGARVVFIGLTTSDESLYARSAVDELSMEDEISCLRKLFDEVKLDDTNDAVFLLSHAGYEKDLEIAGIFDEIDVIFSGNTSLISLYPLEIGETLILQTGDRGEYLGKLNLYVDHHEVSVENFELIQVTKASGEDEGISDYLDEVQSDFDENMGLVLCKSKLDLQNAGIRSQSVGIGNLVVDLLQDYSDADLVVLNAGSIRSGLYEGEVTAGDIYGLFPFENRLMTVRMSGSDLLNLVRKGAQSRSDGAFLCYSEGFEARIDGAEVSASLSGVEIDPEASYVVAISDFLFEDGDGYGEFFSEASEIDSSDELIRDILLNAFSEMDVIDESAVKDENRVIFE